MTTRKRLEGALAEWHPHPKENNSLVPVVRDGGAPDEIADRFFDSEPELPTPEPPVAVEPRLIAIDSAAVRARRRYLMRYVAGAVSVASIIGLAAIVRMTTARDARASTSPRTTSAIAAALPVADPAEPAPVHPDPAAAAPPAPLAAVDPRALANPRGADPAVAAGSPVAEPAVAAAPQVADPAVAAAPPVADPAAAADPPAAAAVAESAPASSQAAADSKKSAADAKKDSQRALERGRLADAIEAGEESVAIDPTDADAWLILGAAYQSKGNLSAARRCYASCAQQAKRGSRGECGALLR